MRAYKTVNDSYVEPISFTVPRRAETFQADIFPPAMGNKPAVSASEWLGGKSGIPAKIDLESIYEGTAPKEVPSDYKPIPKPEPSPLPKAAPKAVEPKEAPKPTIRSPPPTMADQKGSISAMANKYQDNEEAEEEEDETSSFEEISKPPQRGNVRADPPKPVTVPKVQPSSSLATPVTASSHLKSPAGSATPTQMLSPLPKNVESSLDHIKELIENQTRIINAQNDKIGQLVVEVDSLKKKVSSGSQDQSERIRQLELELEEARS
jgi:coronin-1B/1C/6